MLDKGPYLPNLILPSPHIRPSVFPRIMEHYLLFMLNIYLVFFKNFEAGMYWVVDFLKELVK